MDALVEAVDTDLDWVRTHTRLLVRASEWDREGRDASFTLRGADLTSFEDWAAQAPDKEPKPTALQTEYLLVSRRTVTRRQRITFASVAAGLLIAAVLGTVAWLQSEERQRQAGIAQARQLLSRAEAQRDVPGTETAAQISWSGSLRAAIKALQALDALGEPTFDADRAVRKSYRKLPKWTAFEYDNGETRSSGYDPTGRYLALGYGAAAVDVWDVTTGRPHGRCTTDLDGWISAAWPSVDAGGTTLAVMANDPMAGSETRDIFILSLPDCRPVRTLAVPRQGVGSFRAHALSVDARTLVILTESGLEFWDVATGDRRSVTTSGRIWGFAPSPSDRRVAALELGKEDGQRYRRLRIWDMDSARVIHTLDLPRGRSLSWGAGGLIAGGNLIGFEDGAPRLGTTVPSSDVVLSPDGRLFARIVDDRTVEISDTATGAPLGRAVRAAGLSALAFTPDNASLSVVDNYEREVALWHFADDGAFAMLDSGDPVGHLAFSSKDGHLVAETRSQRLGWTLPGPGAMDPPVPLAPEPIAPPATASAAGAGTTEGGGPVLADAIGPTGLRVRIVAIQSTRGGQKRMLELLVADEEPKTRRLDTILDDARASFLRFAGRGRFLVVAASLGFQVLDAATLAPVTTLYHAGATHVGMRADGGTGVTVGGDRTARIWQVATGQERNRIDLPDIATTVALSDDGRWLAAGYAGGGIGVFALAPADLIAQACRWLESPCP